MKFQLGIDIVNYKNNYKGKITSRFCVTVILPCNIQEVLQKLHIQSPNASAVLEINVTDDFNCDELQAYIENMQAKKGLSIDELIKINYAAQKITSMNEKEWQKFSSYAEEIKANTKSSYFESALKMF